MAQSKESITMGQMFKGGYFSSTKVIKVNVESFTGGRRFAVYRKREGIPQSFQENVAEALSRITENNFSQYNSVEVVMEILDVHLEGKSKESITMALMNDPEPVFICVKKYNEKLTQKIENGDVFIVEESKKTHKAGVYLDRQIMKLKMGGYFSSTKVIRVNVESFTGGRRFAVYRKEEGVPQSFKENVAEALSRIPENNLSQYNSVEFVMEILDVHLKPTVSDCMKIAYSSKPKGFKVVKRFSDDYNENAKVGDLFLVQSRILGYGYYHAGVCCSEKGPEIIHFIANRIGSISGPRSGASVSSSIPRPGLVNKVHISGFSSGSKYTIYRLKMGISDSFQDRVDEAMRNLKDYNLFSYNCIHFALGLIYGEELKKDENDVEILIEQFFG